MFEQWRTPVRHFTLPEKHFRTPSRRQTAPTISRCHNAPFRTSLLSRPGYLRRSLLRVGMQPRRPHSGAAHVSLAGMLVNFEASQRACENAFRAPPSRRIGSTSCDEAAFKSAMWVGRRNRLRSFRQLTATSRVKRGAEC
jgi:hypothetical protein